MLTGCPEQPPLPDSDPIVNPEPEKAKILKTSTQLTTDADGTVKEKIIREYDKDKGLICVSKYDKDSKLTEKTEYSYENTVDGTKIVLLEYDSDSKLKGKSEYIYDSNGNQTGYISYDGDLKLTSKRLYNQMEDWYFMTMMEI